MVAALTRVVDQPRPPRGAIRRGPRAGLLSLALAFVLPFEAVGTPSAVIAATCGVERWSVKTGTDPDAGLVNTSVVTPTSVAALDSLPKPVSLPANNRIQPTETTVFSITATLTVFKLEADSDYHLVLSDGSNTMIVEIPSPACVGSASPFLSAITSTRSNFDTTYTATTSFKTANAPVTVTGVGFFDFLPGQTGVAPNGIELHPLLDISFGPPVGAACNTSGAATSTNYLPNVTKT